MAPAKTALLANMCRPDHRLPACFLLMADCQQRCVQEEASALRMDPASTLYGERPPNTTP